MREFYGGVLGLGEMEVPPEVAHLGWIWFSTTEPGVELHFVPHAIAPDPERMHHFCLEVPDVAEARRRLEGSGATVTEPRARIQGRDRVFTRDPLGNLVELVAPLPAG